jgi:hypothetical protein
MDSHVALDLQKKAITWWVRATERSKGPWVSMVATAELVALTVWLSATHSLTHPVRWLPSAWQFQQEWLFFHLHPDIPWLRSWGQGMSSVLALPCSCPPSSVLSIIHHPSWPGSPLCPQSEDFSSLNFTDLLLQFLPRFIPFHLSGGYKLLLLFQETVCSHPVSFLLYPWHLTWDPDWHVPEILWVVWIDKVPINLLRS